MAKKTAKQKRHEWHNLMSCNILSKPYMVKIICRRKLPNRFRLNKFKALVNKMIWENENVGLFSGNCSVLSKGIFMDFPSKKFEIKTSFI